MEGVWWWWWWWLGEERGGSLVLVHHISHSPWLLVCKSIVWQEAIYELGGFHHVANNFSVFEELSIFVEL